MATVEKPLAHIRVDRGLGMNLEDVGYNETLKHWWEANHLDGFEPGRVVEEHKEKYLVRTAYTCGL